MDKLIDLNIKPIVSHGLVHNVLRVSVDYSKRDTGPVARLQAAQMDQPEGKFVGFKVALFGSPSASVVVEKGWKTNNQKRLAAAREAVLQGISQQRGDVYLAIEKLLTKHGSAIVAEQATTTSVAI